ncbi:precorrin-6y C5,15-methyltransferase (decarboxylating) subunit CbiE [Glycomyces buryatensis]|uniref:precorrin-6y C5,15-methyltransferase (decarboxylating) subunit CbiE n=1 Tax=Glycomyces buryatensis TaxID=2570927 RepID=UPI001456286E|nr:precorrin-6y C5,15-methyltransferase (decarboxylating) subunit CbiE [Glycomyces buryatensis]
MTCPTALPASASGDDRSPFTVTVIGVDPSGHLARPIPADVLAVAGGKRHLEAHSPAGIATIPIAGNLDAVIEAISAVPGPVAVLASGDPGWFGILRRLGEIDRPIEIHPAASSVAGAFARIGLTWEDALVVSAHGRDPRPAFATALHGAKVAILTDDRTTPAVIAQALLDSGCGPRRVVVAERLGHRDEAVTSYDLTEAAKRSFADPNVMLVLDETRNMNAEAAPSAAASPTALAHTRAATQWGRPVEDFEHRDGQITKPAVRAAALAALGPGPGRLLWDIGCGSGSAAVEAAALGAGVIALDRDAAQLERARANAAAFGVGIGTVHGAAPDALAKLPDPDAVLIGGGGPDLEPIIDLAASRCRDRIVIALATIERVAPAMRRLEAAGWRATAQLIEVSDLVPLGDGHRLAPRNPVLLVQGEHP